MIRQVSAVLLMVGAVFARAQSRQIPLVDLIESVRGQGHPIVYSSSLIHSGQRVRVDDISLQSLRLALPGLDLQILQRDGVWIIVRGEAAAGPDPVAQQPDVELPVLETVIVTGSLHRFPNTGTASSARTFIPSDMSRVPSLASDAMRVALRLPGMSTLGVSAKPQIRGGLKDELLMIQDGVELLEPFHLADYHSPYSSIDYHTIESLDVYTGGFPSRYGNRMSGVMDIRNHWQDERYNTDIGVSSFANFIHTRGGFGQQHPANWLLSLRQGDLSDLTDYMNIRSGDPEYTDGSARISIALADDLDLAFGVVYAEDDIEFEDLEERASSKIDTGYLWSGLDWQPGSNLGTRLTASWMDFERHRKQDSFEEEAKGGFLDHRQEIQRLAVRNDWRALRGPMLLEFGWQAEYSQGDYDHSSRIDRGELADILGTARRVARDIHLSPDGWSGGAYLQAEWEPAPRLTVQPSLRWDAQDYYLQRGVEQQLSPRLGLAYDINDVTLARLSVGRFYQPEGIQELQVLDGITRFFAPQYSDQAVAGIEWRADSLDLVGEVYYKRYKDQKGRFENTFNPFVLLPEMEPDRVGLYPDRAVAQGVDLDATLRFSEHLSGSLRYSWMDAEDRIGGEWVDRRWSQRHSVNAGLGWNRDDFSLSAALTWHSGWRTTILPAFVARGSQVPVETVLNNRELRAYFSLDISARKSWEIGRTRLQVYADISNLTDRNNQSGVDFDVEEVEGGYELSRDGETLLGRVHSVGITLSF